MASIAGVRLKRSGPVLYYETGNNEVSVNDFVVVETNDGEQVGRIVFTPNQLLLVQLREYAGRIMRLATEDDVDSRALLIL